MVALVDVSVEPKVARDAEKLLAALSELVVEDETLSFTQDWETGQVILHGTSEAHLGTVIDSLPDRYGVNINAGSAQVSYRETLGSRAEVK